MPLSPDDFNVDPVLFGLALHMIYTVYMMIKVNINREKPRE